MKGVIALYTDSMYVTQGMNSVFNNYRQPVCSQGHNSVCFTQVKVNSTVYSFHLLMSKYLF